LACLLKRRKKNKKWQRIRKLQDGRGCRSFLLANTTVVQSVEEVVDILEDFNFVVFVLGNWFGRG
jgi:hypothetical protein